MIRLVAYRKIYKILGVPEIQNIMLEPERGLDMIEGEPEKKRLALMGASTGMKRCILNQKITNVILGALGVAAPPGTRPM